jgi:hypothetical protein
MAGSNPQHGICASDRCAGVLYHSSRFPDDLLNIGNRLAHEVLGFERGDVMWVKSMGDRGFIAPSLVDQAEAERRFSQPAAPGKSMPPAGDNMPERA